jgi:hypothetical protein
MDGKLVNAIPSIQKQTNLIIHARDLSLELVVCWSWVFELILRGPVLIELSINCGSEAWG